MRKCKIFFLSLLVIIAKATSFAQPYKISNDSILEYNKLINKAEILICDSLFFEALCVYNKAFRFLNEPFAIDKYNAAMCAFKADDYKKGETFLEQVVKRGYDYNILQSNAIISFIDSNDQINLFHKLEHCSVEIDFKLKDTYDSLQIIDQYFRKDSLYWITNRDTLCKTDYLNGIFMSDLIDKYGFPSEELVGVSYNLLAALPWELIIIHNQVKPFCNERVNFSTTILDALELGLIRTSKAAAYLEQSIGDEIFGTGFIGLIKVMYKDIDSDTCINNVGFLNLSVGIINKIDSRRISVGLETIAEVRRKIIFNISNTDFIFSERLKVVHSFENLEDYNNFIDNLSLLK